MKRHLKISRRDVTDSTCVMVRGGVTTYFWVLIQENLHGLFPGSQQTVNHENTR